MEPEVKEILSITTDLEVLQINIDEEDPTKGVPPIVIAQTLERIMFYYIALDKETREITTEEVEEKKEEESSIILPSSSDMAKFSK